MIPYSGIKKRAFFTGVFALLVGLFITACVTGNKTTDSKAASDAAHLFLQRLTGESVPAFDFVLVNNEEKNDWYQIQSADNRVVVTATSISALTHGAYAWLNDLGALSVSWEGSRVAIPTHFPDYKGSKVSSSFWQRVYLNVCAYGYTMPWWDWSRWEKEIDWMAAHGVNTPVAMEGQEIVWQKLWKEFSITDEELTSYFSGPAFTAWQRMGNIEAHMGPLPQSWIDSKHKIQVNILQRMRELGMEPVVPAFGGYVPKPFADKYPNAKISKMPPWTGFKEETYWLDPADPLFSQVAKRFIEIYTETYGKSRYYLSDSFNEMLPPVSEDNRYEDLAAYGEAIYQSIHQADPEAIWVMQGWMFGADKHFWDLKSVEAFLSRVPDDRAMVHDIANDRYDVWESVNAFYGKPWIFGYIHNYGGINPVFGDFKFYHEQVGELLEKNNTGNLAGFGVFPEGIHSNSVVYEYLFDLVWKGRTDSLDNWVERYTRSRYGKASPELLHAWSLLEKSVFETRYWQPRWWEGSAGIYVLFKRPDARLSNYEGSPGDLEIMKQAVDSLIAIAPQYADSPLFMYDLVDFFRHYITLRSDDLLQQALIAYQQKNMTAGDRYFNQVTMLVEQLDALLGGQQESLGSWIADAKNYATTPEEATHYVQNAKLQITVWGGPKLKDYASKAWQGMYKEFYLPRWAMFFDVMKSAAQQGVAFDEAAAVSKITEWENNWVVDGKEYTIAVPDEPLKDIQRIRQLLPKN